MKLVLWCYLFLFLCGSLQTQNPDGKSRKLSDGVEFNEVSRSALLKILGDVEENIHHKLQKKKNVKPTFTATFANNIYTKPHIYPKYKKQ
ncbi:unnamed protein product [Spodoptera littoralis]|uniref:Uncharacterized protein n=1 Tax=Spodoptera littoralis TaxID=7109 RepID=A0A9P0N9C0_SPOLI|nr:unnamed protein product [Spodoptera littoralis]